VRQIKPDTKHPILITEAPVSVADEFDRRRRRYLIMMAIRAGCIIGAAMTFNISGWLAAALIAGALVLPWSAVLLANDAPPKQAVKFRRFLGGEGRSGRRQIEARSAVPADQSFDPSGRRCEHGDPTASAADTEEAGQAQPMPKVIDI
jgi:hypothetical protein